MKNETTQEQSSSGARPSRRKSKEHQEVGSGKAELAKSIALASSEKRKTGEAVCQRCGKDFRFYPKDSRGVFCSHYCRNMRQGQLGQDENRKRTRLYRIWMCMRKRCSYPKHHAYHRYGGRGISVCKEWEESFPAFREWAMSNGYVEPLTIDRKDNNGGYNPDNCKFSTLVEQQWHKRNTIFVTAFGETKRLAEWHLDPRAKCKHYYVLFQRVRNYNWEPELAITTPPDKGNTRFRYNHAKKTLQEENSHTLQT